jgi:hypothetical protein
MNSSVAYFVILLALGYIILCGIMEDWERIWKHLVLAYQRHHLGICLEALRKNTKKNSVRIVPLSSVLAHLCHLQPFFNLLHLIFLSSFCFPSICPSSIWQSKTWKGYKGRRMPPPHNWYWHRFGITFVGHHRPLHELKHRLIRISLCIQDNRKDRRYSWIEYENGRILGKKGSCERGVTKVDSWWRWLFWHCSYCFCLCDEQGPQSDRYFNLREVKADVANNK